MRLAAFLLLFCFLSKAQTVNVSDAKTGAPISNVYLFCDNGNIFTNDKGQAELGALKNCNSISFQHPSYTTQTIRLSALKDQYYTLALQPMSVPLQTVEVQFNKWEQEEKRVPIHITEISSTAIKESNPQTTADLLGKSGEVFIQKSQLGGGSPMIRGFATNRILLVVDGVRMNTAIFREGNVQNIIALDANTISKTEVVFGPGAVVYGSDAIGGVLDFHTIQPSFSLNDKTIVGGNYLVRTATANFEKTIHLDLNVGTKKFASLSSLTFSDYDDQIMGSNGPDAYLRNFYQVRSNGTDTVLANPNPKKQIATGFNQINLMQKFVYRPLKAVSVQYGFHYSLSSDVPRYDRLSEGDGNGNLDFAEWRYGPQLWMMHNLSVHLNAKTSLYDRAKTTLAYQQFEESRIDRRFGRDTRRTRTETVDAYSLSVDFEKNLTANLSLYYGLDGVFNQVDSRGLQENINTGITAPVATRYPDNSSWSYQAVYANLQQKINDKLYTQYGLRGNLVQLRGELDKTFYNFPFASINQNFNALNASAGISYLPVKDLQISLNLSNGFRAPNIDDAAKIFDSGDEIVVVPNPNLNPENLYAIDFGILKKGTFWRVEASAYYSYLSNALVREPFTFNGADSIVYDGVLSQVQALQNTSSAQVYGAQINGEIRFATYWQARASYHFITGKTNTGDALRHVSPNFGNFLLGFNRGSFTAQTVFTFNQAITYENLAPSEKEKPEFYVPDGEGNFFSPAWQTVDLRLSWSCCKPLSIQLACENIFDKRYQPYSSGIAAPGRNFVIALRGSF